MIENPLLQRSILLRGGRKIAQQRWQFWQQRTWQARSLEPLHPGGLAFFAMRPFVGVLLPDGLATVVLPPPQTNNPPTPVFRAPRFNAHVYFFFFGAPFSNGRFHSY